MRTIIIGLDAFDPAFFEHLSGQGKTPNLSRLVENGGYARFGVSNPPQSEVSWTSIATGLNPGDHGIFDFVHRDPDTYIPYVSLLPTKKGLAGTQFASPFTARTIFEHVARKGYPATVLWWPATFPARPELPVHTIPGLGTPDILGQLGVGTLFTSNEGVGRGNLKTRVEPLRNSGKNRFDGLLKGPARKSRRDSKESVVKIRIDLVESKSARITLDKDVVELVEGEWSPILEATFRMGLFLKVRAITRFILTSTQPEVRLYMLPLQLHPLHSPWQYATPRGFVKKTWAACGPFLSLGWPQDTTGLEEKCINDDQFLVLNESVHDARERALMYHILQSREGILACVFDSLDRIQHMFWRDRPDIIQQWYIKLDTLIGKVEHALRSHEAGQAKLVVVSDHGFTEFNYKVHLNRWLIDHGYLTPIKQGENGSLKDIDWHRSSAYAIGLNSIYFNLSGREGKGIVDPNQVEQLLPKLRDELIEWQGPDGSRVVQKIWGRDETPKGSLSEHGPDILVGYSPGYRASSQTGLGQWEEFDIELNRDHWGADHCVNPEIVPGVIFSNQGLRKFPSPTYQDFPAIAIGENVDTGIPAPPETYNVEDEKIIEERLKSLGYL